MRAVEKAYDEMIDLFARGSSPKEIVQFHPSQIAQERARYLLDRSKSATLTADEADELDRLGELEILMQLVKARARLYSQGTA